MMEYQRCIVHMVRNMLLHVSHKYKKAFTIDLKNIYHTPNEETGYANMLSIKEKWDKIYPNTIRHWAENWATICLISKYSSEVRKTIYTTNAIESLNSQYRRINTAGSIFPSVAALRNDLFMLKADSLPKSIMNITVLTDTSCV